MREQRDDEHTTRDMPATHHIAPPADSMTALRSISPSPVGGLLRTDGCPRRAETLCFRYVGEQRIPILSQDRLGCRHITAGPAATEQQRNPAQEEHEQRRPEELSHPWHRRV